MRVSYSAFASIFLFSAVNFGCDSTDSDWHKAKNMNTVNAYNEFRLSHPGSQYDSLALNSIADLNWEQTQEAKSFESYIIFMSKFPSSKHSISAKREAQKLIWNELKQAYDLLEKNGDDKSKEKLEQIITIDETNPWALNNLAFIMARKFSSERKKEYAELANDYLHRALLHSENRAIGDRSIGTIVKGRKLGEFYAVQADSGAMSKDINLKLIVEINLKMAKDMLLAIQ